MRFAFPEAAQRQAAQDKVNLFDARAELTTLNARARALGYDTVDEALSALLGYQIASNVMRVRV